MDGEVAEGEAEPVEDELKPLVGMLELPLAVGLGVPSTITELTVRLEVGEREMVVSEGAVPIATEHVAEPILPSVAI